MLVFTLLIILILTLSLMLLLNTYTHTHTPGFLIKECVSPGSGAAFSLYEVVCSIGSK